MAVMLGSCAEKGSAAASSASAPPAAAPVDAARAPAEGSPAGKGTVGVASIYSNSLRGKPMADGKPYDPDVPIAASKTLPIGTVARVTNLENGKSTEVKVEDHGPMVKGRVVDLAPAAANKLGLTKKKGITPVEVKPVESPSNPQLSSDAR